MRDPQAVLARARQGATPATWRTFSKKRSAIGGFLKRTSDDPDPLLVLTPEGSVEYVSAKKAPIVVAFDDVSRIRLRVRGHSFSDSMHVRLDVWVDLHYPDGRKVVWKSASFGDDHRVVQYFIECYGAHRALRGGG